jgi:hypothetical protein
MKPYGQKPEKATSRKIHSADYCGICSTQDWKISKTAARARARKVIEDETNQHPDNRDD